MYKPCVVLVCQHAELSPTVHVVAVVHVLRRIFVIFWQKTSQRDWS